MRTTKSKITSLRNRIKETLPDETDILGFAGVSKQILLQSLDEAYDTLELLESYSGTLEGILLQRRLADLSNDANHFLKDKFKHQDTKDFNDFLYAIGDIHYNTKDAYIALTKEPIRLDSALAKAKTMLDELENQNSEIQPIVEKLNEIFTGATTTAESLSKQNGEASQKLTEIGALLTASTNQKKKIDQAVINIGKIEEKMESIKSDAVQTLSQATILKTEAEKLHESLKKDREFFDQSLNSLQVSITMNDTHQKQIQETIENANRLGMAASFKKRKDELKVPYWGWAATTLLTITGLIVSSYFILKELKENNYSYEFILVRLPIIGAFIWLGWFCAKQFGFVSRIREDYSYKFAVSMAFEGYKNATKEVDEAMLGNLLALTLDNISTSPLNIYDSTTNHGTPFNEVMAGWKRSRRQQPEKNILAKNAFEHKDPDKNSPENEEE